MCNIYLILLVFFAVVFNNSSSLANKKSDSKSASKMNPKAAPVANSPANNYTTSSSAPVSKAYASSDRDMVLSLFNFAIQNAKTDVNGKSYDENVTSITLAAGLNKGKMEYGPMVDITSKNSSSTTKLGGYFDYNLINNTTGANVVYGGTAGAGLVSFSGGTGFGFNFGGVVKYFPAQLPVAFRGSFGYFSDKVDKDSTTSGLRVQAGFAVYF
jgi:hypothetical protein